MKNLFTEMIFFDRPQANNVQVNMNFVELYPFQTEDSNSIQMNILDTLQNKISGIENKIENYATEMLINREFFVEIAVGYENALGWNLHETVFDLGDGFIIESVKKGDIQPIFDALTEFRDFLKTINVDFLYVQNPYKICKNDTIIDVSDFSNDNADKLLFALAAQYIPYLDLRECIHRENIEHRNLFYKTDHHWKTETGLWAARTIVKFLNVHNCFIVDISLFDPNRYQHVIYEDFFLGSAGRKVIRRRAMPEDFILLYPEFVVDFSFLVPSRNIDKHGSFDVVYDLQQFDKKNFYSQDIYSTYIYGDKPITIIHNNLLKNGKEVLFIIDSFANVVLPFLALGIENIVALDLRHFTGSVKTYIEQNKFDMVIVMYNPSFLSPGNEQMFNFR
ncbi:membrane protein [Spirochaetia bacterium]|nr:membrane protein [Spirochaetia bacterium]